MFILQGGVWSEGREWGWGGTDEGWGCEVRKDSGGEEGEMRGRGRE